MINIPEGGRPDAHLTQAARLTEQVERLQARLAEAREIIDGLIPDCDACDQPATWLLTTERGEQQVCDEHADITRIEIPSARLISERDQPHWRRAAAWLAAQEKERGT